MHITQFFLACLQKLHAYTPVDKFEEIQKNVGMCPLNREIQPTIIVECMERLAAKLKASYNFPEHAPEQPEELIDETIRFLKRIVEHQWQVDQQSPKEETTRRCFITLMRDYVKLDLCNAEIVIIIDSPKQLAEILNDLSSYIAASKAEMEDSGLEDVSHNPQRIADQAGYIASDN